MSNTFPMDTRSLIVVRHDKNSSLSPAHYVLYVHASTCDLYDHIVHEKGTSQACLNYQTAVFDALAVFGGFMLATLIQLDNSLCVSREKRRCSRRQRLEKRQEE